MSDGTGERGSPTPPAAPPGTLVGELPPTPPGPPPVGRWIAAGWPTALIQGGLAFALVALLGQVAAFAVYLVGDFGDVPVSTFVRIGWFYFGWFHHVPLVATMTNLDLGVLGELLPGPGLGAGALSYEIGLAPLVATGLAVWLLHRAGRRVADAAGGGPVARALQGLKVALVYALPSLVLSMLVSIRISAQLGMVGGGDVEMQSSVVQAFLLPFLIAFFAAASGGLRSARRWLIERDPRFERAHGALAGGWRMLVLGLALAYAGLFVAGAVQPDEPVAALTPSTAKYFETVFEDFDRGAVILAHHLAVAPNEAMWVLVPAMGGCDGVSGSGSFAFLCYWKFPQDVTVPENLPPAVALASTPAPPATFAGAPAGYYLFVLAPAAAVLLGGRHAARAGRARTRSEAAALGGGAGASFAVLVVAVGYLSSITAGVTTSLFGLDTGGSVRIGPDLISGGLLALAWGVVGGTAGGVFEGRRLPRRLPPGEPLAEAPLS